jgi:hypothetical protein
VPRYIDLDDLVPTDITVRVRGEEYQLPGDVPVPEYLALTRLAGEIVDGSENPEQAVVDLHDRLLALFQVHQPDLTELPVGPRALLPLVFRYLDAPAEEEADTADPSPADGTTTKPAGDPPQTPTTPPRRSKATASST